MKSYDTESGTHEATDSDEQPAGRGGRGSRERGEHRRRHGGRSRGHRRGHPRADCDDIADLERYQRDLEQRGADINARIDEVRDRIAELR